MEGLDNGEVDSNMPDTWWPQSTNIVVYKSDNIVHYLFAVEVHQKNTGITIECTSQPTCQTRNQHQETTAQIKSTVRQNERAAIRQPGREVDLYFHQEKKQHLMVVNTSILEKLNDMISK